MTLRAQLPIGVEWGSEANVVSVWCRQFGIDFGHAILRQSDECPESVTIIRGSLVDESKHKLC